ncbi:hypothetical protein EYZ11_009840 [Aspergillus tanneri]|uniref:Sphingomyelin phosphodiesterase n=1 Tax=Aspergillus tanneri TaxID=1220188 RepID=A0A4S3J6W8_9EURO|nr:Sphingomyelin phosphodiesterase [Aspergillus tanneri]KAA8649172.1 Sphingomyelin phosphodiesterase [Aspergillus tanneri]THC90703.1 hypothetical protein EYZ11_009840 [Aspergillus tanneri]
MKISLLLPLLSYTVASVQADWVQTIVKDIKNAITCAGCEGLLGALKLVADIGEGTLIRVITDVCIVTNIEDKDVCTGLIAEQGPSVYYALKNLHLGSDTSHSFCAHVLGLCEYPPVNTNLNLSKAPAASRPTPSGKNPLRIAHISDTHVDHAYEPGTSAFCTKPICCRAWNDDNKNGNVDAPCGVWGDPHADPPDRLEASMIASVAEHDPGFTLYTGDVPPHDIWMVNKSEVLSDIQSTYGQLGKLGTVYAALGNHDAAPVNLFPAPPIPAEYSPQWAYDALADEWTKLSSPKSKSSAPNGCYSAIHNNRLRIISYNSILYYKYNFYAWQDPMPTDPDGVLAWIKNELSEAESAHQRVWLIAHIPSGGPDTLHEYSAGLDQLVTRYRNTIAAVFYGHTHTDGFQISYTDYEHRTADSAAAIGYIAPSLTPTSGPPAYRIYEVDPVTFAVLDYTEYVANVTSLSPEDQEEEKNPQWTKYYSAKEAYGKHLDPPITDPTVELSPAFWHNVTLAMERDPQIFRDYWARTTRGYNVTQCEGDCATKEICALRAGDARFNCDKGGDFSGLKRELPDRPVCDDGLARLLRKMVSERADLEHLILRHPEIRNCTA